MVENTLGKSSEKRNKRTNEELSFAIRDALIASYFNRYTLDDVRGFLKDDINREHLVPQMENFYMNLPWGKLYNGGSFYNKETAAKPRKETGRSIDSWYSQYFLDHSPDQLFKSIDESIQKHNIDTDAIEKLLKNPDQRVDLYRMVVDVFVDLLEEWYTWVDLRS